MYHLTIHNGCETNLYDSEKVKLFLLSRGLAQSPADQQVDLVVFHACSFSQQKEDESKEIIKKLLEGKAKKIVVSGCYLNEYIKDDAVSYIKHEKLAEYLSHFLPTNPHQNQPEDLLPLIQISKGCYGTCTFCSIKSVKGIHKSRSVTEILDDIEKRSHSSTIKLVGDEVAGYGLDIDLNLSILIQEIVKRFPALKIKLGSLNAKILKRLTPEELSIFAHENISGNIHIPIQSASNRILAAMNRGYTIEEYVEIYSTLKQIGVNNISGDIIAGFPGETADDHKKNIELLSVNEYQFMEVFMYEARPNTKAATMQQIDLPTKERRTTELLAAYLNSYSKQNSIPYEALFRTGPVFNTNLIVNK